MLVCHGGIGFSDRCNSSAMGGVHLVPWQPQCKRVKVIPFQLLQLPVEIVIEILFHLDPVSDILKFRGCSKRCKTLVDTEMLWKRLCRREEVEFPVPTASSWQQHYKEMTQLYWVSSSNQNLGFNGSIGFFDNKTRAEVLKDGNCMAVSHRPVRASDTFFTEIYVEWREEHWYRSVGLVPQSAPQPIDSNHKLTRYGWKLSSRRGRVGHQGRDREYLVDRVSSGDRIGILLNTKGELRFSVNGRWHPVAFDGITEREFYPAVYLYCKGDSASIARKRFHQFL